jgi:hypothetical protein
MVEIVQNRNYANNTILVYCFMIVQYYVRWCIELYAYYKMGIMKTNTILYGLYNENYYLYLGKLPSLNVLLSRIIYTCVNSLFDWRIFDGKTYKNKVSLYYIFINLFDEFKTVSMNRANVNVSSKTLMKVNSCEVYILFRKPLKQKV